MTSRYLADIKSTWQVFKLDFLREVAPFEKRMLLYIFDLSFAISYYDYRPILYLKTFFKYIHMYRVDAFFSLAEQSVIWIIFHSPSGI